MRQEMKVGFAIGGVLLAVLVVYVLVVSSRDAHKSDQVGLDTGGATVSFPADHAGDQSKTGTNKIETNKPAAPTDIIGTGGSVVMQPDKFPTGPTTSPSNTETAKAPGNDPWASALNTGSIPTLMSTTPTARTGSSRVVSSGPTDVQILDKVNFNLGNDDAFKTQNTGSTTRPSSTDSARTHTVASGETLSSIAAAAYGNSAYYPHILRANPNLDPKKLKVGTVLNMPAVDDVKPSNTIVDTKTSSAKTVTADFTPKKPIDEKSQYVVLPGDSLYRISVKLYGKADHVDKIAQANKGEIGAERRLKVGQVLALPEAPTVTR